MVTGHREPPIYDSTALRIPLVYELGELVRYRFLLGNLIARDLKVRYKRSILGIAWAMLNPLLTMGVMALVFSKLFQRNVDNFPIYLLSGLLLWNLFSQGTTFAIASILGNRNYLVKVYVPSSAFVVSAVGGALINLLFSLGPLLVLTLLSGLPPRLTWLALIVPIMQTAMFSLGIGLILAATVVFFVDIRDIHAVVLRAFFYLTPVIYPASILPPVVMRAERFNPMYYLLSSFRTMLLDGGLPGLGEMLLATLVGLGVMVIGWAVFTRLADRFAYHV